MVAYVRLLTSRSADTSDVWHQSRPSKCYTICRYSVIIILLSRWLSFQFSQPSTRFSALAISRHSPRANNFSLVNAFAKVVKTNRSRGFSGRNQHRHVIVFISDHKILFGFKYRVIWTIAQRCWPPVVSVRQRYRSSKYFVVFARLTSLSDNKTASQYIAELNNITQLTGGGCT